MKTLEELMAIRNKMQNQVNIRAEDSSATRVVISMPSCGIDADVRLFLKFFYDGVQEKGLKDIMVTQTGCIGLCQYEPIVEVIQPGKEKVTYIKMTAEKAAEVIEQHLIGGDVVSKYTINNSELK